jgi:hypothetical protein
MDTPAESSPPSGRKTTRRKRPGLKFLIRVGVLVVFLFGIYGSMRLGIHMANNRLPNSGEVPSVIGGNEAVTLGRSGDPVYLADSPDSLRSFFSRFPTPGERASADLTGLSIRRITSPITMNTIRAEADAVEVEITSGAIAGSVYWVRHSQMPDPSKFDPILSPVPPGRDDGEEKK